VAAPTRIENYKYRQFTVAVASSATQFLAAARNDKSVQVAHSSARSHEEVRFDIERQLSNLSFGYQIGASTNTHT
jgi:hypothetical protein